MEVHRQLYCGRYWVELYVPGIGVYIFCGLTTHEADKKANEFLERIGNKHGTL